LSPCPLLSSCINPSPFTLREMREMRINDHLTCFYNRESFDPVARSVRSELRSENDDTGTNETKAVTGAERTAIHHTNHGNRSISGRKPRPRRPRKPTADPIVMTWCASRGTQATSGVDIFGRNISSRMHSYSAGGHHGNNTHR
jgi:hypothetical protein